jgi:hypothetical protein
MRALFEARLSDLGPCDFVKVECTACVHVEMLTATMLGSAGVKAYETILDLESKMRCRQCDARGKAMVSIKWAAA